MAILPCPACQKPMNAVAVVCPHCNARRAGVTPGLVGKTLSPAEIHALILTDVALAPPAPAQGLLATFVLPHPSTIGTARAVELALTVVCLPLVAAGVVTFAVTRRKTQATHGELAPTLAMMIVGGLGLSSLLSLADVSLMTNLALTGASVVALIARAVIRSRAATAHRRGLLRLTSDAPAVPNQP